MKQIPDEVRQYLSADGRDVRGVPVLPDDQIRLLKAFGLAETLADDGDCESVLYNALRDAARGDG